MLENLNSFASQPDDSEFSFKKSPLGHLKGDKFEMNVHKLDTFSSNRDESPSNKIAESNNTSEKPLLSFNLMSCLEDIDKSIDEKHKGKMKQPINMDERRFKQIKQPQKITKYEEEYIK
jgi:hypothetical protein